MKLAYDHDDIKIYWGDARDMSVLPKDSVHMVITSPPYWNAREYSYWETYDDYLADMLKVWKGCYRVLVDGGRIAVNVPQGYGRPANGGYINIGADTAYALQSAKFELRGNIIWNKPMTLRSTAWGSWLNASNPSLRDKHELIVVGHKKTAYLRAGASTIGRDEFLLFTQSVWDVLPATSSWHPAPFPEEIPYRLMQLYTFKDNVILDPFGGTMTTAFVAARNGRKAIAIEQSLDYIKEAVGTMFLTPEIIDNQ